MTQPTTKVRQPIYEALGVGKNMSWLAKNMSQVSEKTSQHIRPVNWVASKVSELWFEAGRLTCEVSRPHRRQVGGDGELMHTASFHPKSATFRSKPAGFWFWVAKGHMKMNVSR